MKYYLIGRYWVQKNTMFVSSIHCTFDGEISYFKTKGKALKMANYLTELSAINGAGLTYQVKPV